MPTKKNTKKKPGPKKGSKRKPQGPGPRITKKQIENAIEGSAGIKTVIARKAGISRVSLWKYLKHWPELEDLIQDEAEQVKDEAEAQIIKQIRSGNTPVLIFFAKTKMKDRGYVEKQEIDVDLKKAPDLTINLKSD
jgi:hypothetical protein